MVIFSRSALAMWLARRELTCFKELHMRKLMIALCSGALMVGGLSYRTLAADENKTVEGELVDTHCYSSGGGKGAEHAACGEKCAKSGIPVGVLADGKVMVLATNPKPLASAVGKTVRATGSAGESGVFIPEKVEVKDGDNWKEIKLNDAHHKGNKDEEKKEAK
jgi:hypothetical protein